MKRTDWNEVLTTQIFGTEASQAEGRTSANTWDRNVLDMVRGQQEAYVTCMARAGGEVIGDRVRGQLGDRSCGS